MTTKIPVELSSTPSIVDGGNATAITIDSSENCTFTGTTTTTGYVINNNTALFDDHSTLSAYSDTNGVYLNGKNAGWLSLSGDGTQRNNVRIYGQASSSGELIQFKTANSERMRIDSSGNLLIGTTSTGFSDQGVIITDGQYVGTMDGSHCMTLNRKSSDGLMLRFYKDESLVGSIAASGGDLTIGTGDTGIHFHDGVDSLIPWNTSTANYRDNAIDLGTSSYRFNDAYVTNGVTSGSDRNEKENITQSDLGLTFIKELNPVSYTWKNNNSNRTHYGLISQDIETWLSDNDKNNTDFAGLVKTDVSEEQDGSSYKYGLRYNEFVSPLIKAIQEQQEQIEALQSEINTLKGGE